MLEPTAAPTLPRLLNAVPMPGLFVGREDLLTRLHQVLAAPGRPVLLHGLGGLGKTTAALAYVHSAEARAAFPHVACFFVNGDLTGAMLDNELLLTNLGITDAVRQARAAGDEARAFATVLQALQQLPGRNLLLFDNLEDSDNVAAFLANFDPDQCALLLTSRHEIEQTARISIEELPEAAAADLFCRLYYDEAVPPEAARDPHLAAILRHLDRHTLLIHMVALAGREAGYPLPDLARFVEQEYIRHQELQLAVGTGRMGDPDEMRRARVRGLVSRIFAELNALSETDQTYLRYFALLPAVPLPYDRLLALFRVPADASDGLRDALLRLRRRGLLLEKGGPATGEAKAWSLHRLVREAVIEHLRPDWENCRPLVAEVTQQLRVDESKDNPVDKFSLLPFGEAIVQGLPEANQPEKAELLDKMGWIYLEMGQVHKSAALREQALVIDRAAWGDDHPYVAGRRANLAVVCNDLGQYERARDLLELALAAGIKHHGEDHPEVANFRSNLALVYGRLGEAARARELLDRTLAADLKTLGEGHPNVAIRRTFLAEILNKLGELAGARRELELALESDLKNFPSDHPRIITNRVSLAFLYGRLGEAEKADGQLVPALESALKIFGEDHPEVARIYSTMAHCCTARADYAQAQASFQKAVDILLRIFGETHPHVAAIQRNLTIVEAAINGSTPVPPPA